MRVSATLAWRYLRGRPGRTLLTTLAIVFGVALIFGLNGMMPSLVDVFNRMLFSSAGQVDMSVTSTSGGTFDRGVADDVARVPGVAAATPLLRHSVGMPNDSPVSIITLVGIDPRTAAKVREFSLSAGRMIAAGDAGEVVIGGDTAETLRLDVGSRLAIPTVSGLRAVLGCRVALGRLFTERTRGIRHSVRRPTRARLGQQDQRRRGAILARS